MTAAPNYLTLAANDTNWPGLQNITKLILFGDSYTYYGSTFTLWPEQLKSSPGLATLELRNYAMPGNTMSYDLERQILRFFAQAKDSHYDDSTQTLYVVWFGINDVGMVREEMFGKIFQTFTEQVTKLYEEAGGRNFLFIDVPPIERAPGIKASGSATMGRVEKKAKIWNELLRERVLSFSERYPSAITFVFSAHKAIGEYLDDPIFEDGSGQADGIWEDNIHMTDVVHEALAAKIAQELSSSR